MTIKNNFLLVLISSITLISCVSNKTLFPFEKDGKFGLKTQHGNVKIQPDFDRLFRLEHSTYFIAKQQLKWCLIDENGKQLTEICFSRINQNYTWKSENHFFRVGKDGKYGVIDGLGNEIIPIIYSNLTFSGNELITVRYDRKYGVININGEEIIPITYDYLKVARNENELIVASKNKKYGFISIENETIIPFIYDGAKNFSEDLAMVSVALHKWGYINRDNDTVIPFIYGYPFFNSYGDGRFNNGVARVKLDKKIGYINKTGKVVVPIIYSDLDYYYSGYASAARDGLYGYVDSLGNEYLIKEFDNEKPEWGVISKAPNSIPDYSDKLYIDTSKIEDLFGEIIGESTIYTIDSSGKQVIDTSWYEYSAPSNIDDEISGKDSMLRGWTLEMVLNDALIAFRQEPKTYSSRSSLLAISSSYGLLIGRGNYGAFMYSPNGEWDEFKIKTIYKIIGNESLRQLTWEWVSPYYRKSYLSMHQFHRDVYIEIIEGLREYINNYDRKKVEKHLKRSEKKFAHYNLDNEQDHNRKIYAFLDRLIILHKVISEEEAKVWINKIADEISSWE